MGLFGGGSDKAGKALARAAEQSLALQREIFNTSRPLFDKQINVGADATGALAGLAGLGGDGGAAIDRFQQFFDSPAIQFQLGEGIKALDRSAAARGNLFSGRQGRALTEFGQNFAGQKFNEEFQRLTGLSQLGNQGASSLSAGGANVSNAINQLGQAQAARALGKANERAGLLGSALSIGSFAFGGGFGGLGGGSLGGLGGLFGGGGGTPGFNPAGLSNAGPVQLF